MNAHGFPKFFQRHNFIPLLIVLLALIVVAYGFASGIAQSQKDGETVLSDNERKFENTVPEHVPIKIKLKNEQSFKKKENTNWAREMEIEVKNTGAKPIYYLYVSIHMPEIIVNGNMLGMRTTYGRKELGLPETPVEPEDVPILPGESITLKFPEKQIRGYEKFRDEDRMYTDPKKVVFNVLIIKFGDGTYLFGPDGKPMHSNPKKDSYNNLPLKDGSIGCKAEPEIPKTESSGNFRKSLYSTQPVSLLRANFFLPDNTANFSPTPLRDDCGCQTSIGGDCIWGKIGFSSCPCDEQVPDILFAGGCANNGQCLRYVKKNRSL